jgi:electron transfer flavoprotein alpha subunit
MANNILVVAEHFQGHVTDITFELLGEARELARALGGNVGVALLGHDVGGLVSELGAAAVVYAADRPELREFTPDAYAAVLGIAVAHASPRVVLLGSTSVGLDLLSLLSARVNLPCIDNCTAIKFQDGGLVATSQIYGGKVFAEVLLTQRTTLIAVAPGMFPAEAGRVSGKPQVVQIPHALVAPEPRTSFRRWIEPPPGDVDITKVPVLVSIGRGIKNAENVPQAQELADLLGGAVSGSRPVIDQGWLPKTRQVGKSGMTVKPKLYLALGVSGAPEHVEGMRGAELIVAINTDPQAPIFSVAHYGVVADVFDILPSLTEEIKARQDSSAA